MEEGVGLGVEDGAPVGMDGFEEDVLDGQGVLIAGIEFAAALGLSDADPVGGTVAGPAEAGRYGCGPSSDGTYKNPKSKTTDAVSAKAAIKMTSATFDDFAGNCCDPLSDPECD